ncbi:acetate--CoA ligase family protein [Chloroflexota bacterium]
MSNVKRHFLDSFFYPESVAVVGASNNVQTANFNLMGNLINLKFRGKIYPVNPNAEEILGIKAYPDLKSIEENIDLVVVSVPAGKVLDVIHDCVAKKVEGVVLVSGGFSETGEEGKRRQEEVFGLLRESGIRTIGPNTLSPINTENNLVISFHAIEKMKPGKLSFIFQSGLYDPRINWWFSEFNLYLNKLIDLGNKMDISEVDALEYLGQDPGTKVIALHLESIAGDARAFMRLLKQISREKPVIVLKSGRTEAGAKAASSHTGAIIKARDVVFDAALKQAGAIRVQTLDECFDLAKTFEYLYPPKSNRIHVSTGSGGEGVLATDLCQCNGFTMAQPGPETYKKLRAIFPPWEINLNPFDLGVAVQFRSVTDIFRILLSALADDQNVDCLALELGGYPVSNPENLIDLASEVIKRGKPVAIWMAAMQAEDSTMVHKLEAKRVPVYPSVERAIRALSALYRCHKMQEAIRGDESG